MTTILGGDERLSIQQLLNDRDLEKGNALLLQNDFLFGGGRSLYIFLFCLTRMNFESFFVEVSSHILEMLVDIVSDQLKGLLNVLGIEFFFLLPRVLLYHKRRKSPLNLMVVTDGATDHAGGYLFLTGSAVLKPALELMSVRTEKIESNHLRLPENSNTSPLFWQVFSWQRGRLGQNVENTVFLL
jgi:hypothetical protein